LPFFNSRRASSRISPAALPPELPLATQPVDDSQRIAHTILQRLEREQLKTTPDWRLSPGQFDLSSRQIRRIIQKELVCRRFS